MAYAPPPGTNSLPARPPASNNRSGFKPAFASPVQPPSVQPQPYSSAAAPYAPVAASYAGAAAAAGNYAAPSHYASRPQYGASSQYTSAASYAPSSYPGYTGSAPGVSSAAQGYAFASQQPQHGHQQQPLHQQSQQQQQQAFGSHNPGGYAHSSYAPPQIQNPFPAPGSAASGFDPSEAAQIAEWQSAYNGIPQVGRDGKPVAVVAEPTKPESPALAANADKKKTVMRQGGGKKWTDDTLLDWDPSHLRLFVGNLAGETTDESLLKAFARWKSVQRSRVIRDKRTTKSKGYGFVSFSDPDDFFQAAKEMNGKYIQSHPVVVRKANTEIKVSNVKEKGKGGKNSAGKHNKNKAGSQQHGSGSGAGAGAGGYEPSLGPIGGGGVTKPGQKTKNGLRLLG